jgi:hypothetical protein
MQPLFTLPETVPAPFSGDPLEPFQGIITSGVLCEFAPDRMMDLARYGSQERSQYDGDGEGDGESDSEDDAIEMDVEAEGSEVEELEADEEDPVPEEGQPQQQEQEDEEASVPGGPTPRPSRLRHLERERRPLVTAAASDLVQLVLAVLGDDNHLLDWLSMYLPEERDRVALKSTSKQLSVLIFAQVGLSVADLARLTTVLSAQPLRVHVERALLSECVEDEGLDSLREGGAAAGIDLKLRGRAAQEKMLGRVASAKAVVGCLMDVRSDMGLGLIPLGKENAIAAQLLLAHNRRRCTFEDKGDIVSVDITDLSKFGEDACYADLHELCQRVHGVSRAGQSRSSGGGEQIDRNRLHIRQPLADGRTTPGGRLRHLDEVSNVNVPSEVLELARSDPARCRPSPPDPT